MVHAIIGPPCATSAIISGILGSFYSVPVFTWGSSTTAELADVARFPTVANVNANTYTLGLAIFEVMDTFSWDEFALIYTIDPEQRKCDFFQQDVEKTVSEKTPNIVYKRQLTSTKDGMLAVLEALKPRARIIVACIDSNDLKRDFMIRADEMQMNTDEYVYIFPNLQSQGMLKPVNASNGNSTDTVNIWVDYEVPPDGLDKQALATARRSIVVDLENQDAHEIEAFNVKVQDLIGKPPFYCDASCMGSSGETRPSVYVRSLYDATYMYLRAINQTIEKFGIKGLENGTLVAQNSRGDFQGMTGYIRINENGTREPVFYVSALDDADTVQVFAKISVQGNSVMYEPQYQDEYTTIWSTRNRKRPLTVPICGFGGNQCPVSPAGYIVIGVGGGLLLLLLFGGALGYGLRQRMLEERRLNEENLIDWGDLTKMTSDPNNKSDMLKSLRSMSSNHSTSTRFTQDNFNETDYSAYFSWNKEIVFASKILVRPKFTKRNFIEVRQMRQIDHDNINRLLGICINGPQLLFIWKYAQRGSLTDVLARDNYLSDAFFSFALMRDVANGLNALHNSFINVHGALTSHCCLINDRWQVKISDYGCDFVRALQPIPLKQKLWMAPELIREDNRLGTQPGDVYSFAIICSELVNRRPAWNYVEREDEIEDIIFAVKRSSEPPARPEIEVPVEMNNNLLHLIRDCWDENPAKRPKMDVVKNLMKSMMKNGKQSLMDYVFNMLEQYAGSLEEEVEDRTKELVEEKKKSDILLYRMLPKQVAEELKSGKVVEPESFDMVTVFFSDVVSFTTLASKCTPFQVVNLLNALYTNFDSIIDGHDVYKVETIGDGYLCVSGLPHRNGNNHVNEIAEMSMNFLNSLITFRVPHLPNVRINLRIGFHTGPCVAGVVGLTMPRYCLFGDTVNTASRMESNGKPGQIHVSADANHYLTKVVGGYETESRGEVIIKGKGVMETYWLLGRSDGTLMAPPPPAVAAAPAVIIPADPVTMQSEGPAAVVTSLPTTITK
uniref:Guanylate cyclase n=1 Tax=Panagrellus redivivus TaxID=6233 RepID=A0A7E4ZTS6_PANRE